MNDDVKCWTITNVLIDSDIYDNCFCVIWGSKCVGESTNVGELKKEIDEVSNDVEDVIFTGCDPVEQSKALTLINLYAQSLGLNTTLVTSVPYKFMPTNLKKAFNYIYKDGKCMYRGDPNAN